MAFKIISFGDNIKPGKYKLHSSFKKVENFQKGSRLVSLVLPEIGPGPNNIVINRLSRCRQIEIKEKEIVLENIRVSNPDSFYVSSARVDIREENIRRRIVYCVKKLLFLSPPLSMSFVFDSQREKNFSSTFEKEMLERMKFGIKCLREGKTSLGTRSLCGLGFGLTPSGDDFLSGFSLFLSLKEEEKRIKRILSACKSRNLISYNLLRNSAAGKVEMRVKIFLKSLAYGKLEELDKSMADVIRRGHSSGADFLSGFLLSFFTHDLKKISSKGK
ncbi:MAG: hypothetical protein Fur0012_01380 [Elusimicrobiota bacterium]